MAKVLEWNITQDDYLKRAHQIDVKENEETLEIIADKLKLALDQHKELPYATANQVGYDYSVYAIRVGDHYEVWANPLMSRSDDNMILVTDKEFGLKNNYYIPRWPKISVIAYSFDKKLVCTRDYENEAAAIMQHVMNNLDGISLQDIGLEITPEFATASEEDQREVVMAYIKELENLLNVLEKDIKQDSEANAKYEAFKFVKARAAKEIDVVEKPVKQNRKMRRWLNKLFKKKGK